MPGIVRNLPVGANERMSTGLTHFLQVFAPSFVECIFLRPSGAKLFVIFPLFWQASVCFSTAFRDYRMEHARISAKEDQLKKDRDFCFSMMETTEDAAKESKETVRLAMLESEDLRRRLEAREAELKAAETGH